MDNKGITMFEFKNGTIIILDRVLLFTRPDNTEQFQVAFEGGWTHYFEASEYEAFSKEMKLFHTKGIKVEMIPERKIHSPLGRP